MLTKMLIYVNITPGLANHDDPRSVPEGAGCFCGEVVVSSPKSPEQDSYGLQMYQIGYAMCFCQPPNRFTQPSGTWNAQGRGRWR
jgi:hypothetical protein